MSSGALSSALDDDRGETSDAPLDLRILLNSLLFDAVQSLLFAKCRDAEDTRVDDGEVKADADPRSDREIASADRDTELAEGKVRILLEVRGGSSWVPVCVRSRDDERIL